MNEDCIQERQIAVRPIKIAALLLIVSVLIVIAGSVAHIVRHQVIDDLEDPRADILRRLDIVEEPSLSQWFQSSMHLTAAFLAAGIGLSVGGRMFLRWIGLSCLFTYASIDEAIMIHEMMDRPVKEFLGTSGFLAIAWIIPGSFIALVIGGFYLSFLRSLSPRVAGLVFAGGVVFLCGAILMEVPGGYLYEKYGFASWHYIASYAIEELLEMMGVIIFIYGLLCFIDEETRDPAIASQALKIQVRDRSKASVEV